LKVASHGVAIIGWGTCDDYGLYWIVKNSTFFSPTDPGIRYVKASSLMIRCRVSYLAYSERFVAKVPSTYSHYRLSGEPISNTGITWEVIDSSEPLFTNMSGSTENAILNPLTNAQGSFKLKFLINYPSAAGISCIPDDPEEVISESSFWIGAPADGTIIGPTEIGCNEDITYTITSESIDYDYYHTWSATGSLSIVSVAGNLESAVIRADFGGLGQITVDSQNGSGITTTTVLDVGSLCYTLLAFPNPANDILYIEVENFDLEEEPEFYYDLVSDKGQNKKSKKTKEKKTSIIISDIEEGSYVLRCKMKLENGVIVEKSQQIIISR